MLCPGTLDTESWGFQCCLEAGHEGKHKDACGFEWTDEDAVRMDQFRTEKGYQ